mmetsp:Transcript_13325/g.38263  ORF Transcript_13325/g.38263 Transcript_13325/m.38263 type:complete len:263 (+) Transcript_13325:474-1262(+)
MQRHFDQIKHRTVFCGEATSVCIKCVAIELVCGRLKDAPGVEARRAVKCRVPMQKIRHLHHVSHFHDTRIGRDGDCRLDCGKPHHAAMNARGDDGVDSMQRTGPTVHVVKEAGAVVGERRLRTILVYDRVVARLLDHHKRPWVISHELQQVKTEARSAITWIGRQSNGEFQRSALGLPWNSPVRVLEQLAQVGLHIDKQAGATCNDRLRPCIVPDYALREVTAHREGAALRDGLKELKLSRGQREIARILRVCRPPDANAKG